MQGIHLKELHETMAADESNSFLIDLAGNGMHVWCAASCLLASLVVRAEAWAKRG